MTILQNICAELLGNGLVQMIIGYKKSGNRTVPFIARTINDTRQLIFDNNAVNNLAVYLTRLKLPPDGKTGIVAKGCDIRSVTALIQENQIRREQVYIIGVECFGVTAETSAALSNGNVMEKCRNCSLHSPHLYDTIVKNEMPVIEINPPQENFLKRIEDMDPKERFAFWESQFENCVRCYACRQACPLCYCTQCIADKTVPQWIESSSTKRANFSWNLIRAFHLAGRCTGCGECTRACPADIPLSLLNMKMAALSLEQFGYRHGMDVNEPTLVGSYSSADKEDFIM